MKSKSQLSKMLLIALTLLMGLGAVAEATPPPVYHGQAILAWPELRPDRLLPDLEPHPVPPTPSTP